VDPPDRRIPVYRGQSTPELHWFGERHDWPVNGDTTSTYFETEQPDPPTWRDATGHRLPDPGPTGATPTGTTPTGTTGEGSTGEGSTGDGTTDVGTRQDGTAPVGGGEGGGQDEGAGARPEGGVERVGFRTHGKSKDSRDDLPQIVIGMAVTRDGIPVRVWCWPGNTGDSPLIRQVKDDLRDWTLGKVIWVADRGFTSAANRRHLMAGGGGYILGEKLRSGSAEATAALSRQAATSRSAPTCGSKKSSSPT